MAESPSLPHQGLSKEGQARQETQKKTFTKWLNAHLRKADAKVEDLFVDLRDGVKLIQLLEVLRGARLPREKGKMRLHKVANLNAVLKFLKSDGVRLVNIDAGDLCDGNVKLTLGLIWTLILNYQISGAGGDGQAEGKAKLLEWCRQCTEPYSNVEVTNFTTSWRNGLAFNAIIHRHRPELVDYGSLSPDNAHANLQQAFDVAESELNVAALLDAEDVAVSTPDEKSILTYVALLKGALPDEPKEAADAPAEKAETDGGLLLQEKESLAQSANDLLEWTNAKKKDLSPPYNFPLGDVGALRSLLSYHEAFLAGDEFASKKGEKERLVGEIPDLAERLCSSNDSEHADLKPNADEINSAWDGGLLPEEKTYRAALEKSIAEAEERARSLKQNAADLQRWAEEKTLKFSARSAFPDDWAVLNALSEQLEKHESSDLLQKDQQKCEIEEELSKFAKTGSVDSAILECVDGLLAAWQNMSTERPLYKDALLAAIAQLREKLRQKKVDRMDAMLKWLHDSTHTFKVRDFPDDVSNLEDLLAELDSFEGAQKPPKKSESDNLQTDIEKMASQSDRIIENDEAQGDCQKLNAAWTEMEKEKVAYREELEKRLQKQLKAVKIRKDVDNLLVWVAGKRKQFANRRFPADLESLQTLRSDYDDEYLSDEFPPRHLEKNDLAQQIEDEEQFVDQKEELQSIWKSLHQEQAEYRKALENAIVACQARQQTYADSNDLMRWARQKQRDFLQRDFASSSKEQLVELLSALDTFDEGEFPEKKSQKAAVDVRLQDAGETDLDFEDTWDAMFSAHRAYRAALEAALKDREEKEKHKKQLDELGQWITVKRAAFVSRDFPPSLDKLRHLASEFDNGYLLEEQPPKEDERVQLGQALEDDDCSEAAETLRESWEGLAKEQRQYRSALDAAIRDAEAQLARSAELQKWVDSKQQAFSQRDFPTDRQALEALCSAYDDYAAKELPDKAEEVGRFVSEHVQMAAAPVLQDSFKTLQTEQSNYRTALEEALKRIDEEEAAARRQQQLDELKQWISAKQSVFSQLNFPSDMKKLQQLAVNFDDAYLTGERPPKQADKDRLANAFTEHGETTQANELSSLWATMQDQQEKYRQELEAALQRLAQQDEDRKRRLNALNGWIATRRKTFLQRDFPSDVDALRQLADDFDSCYLGSELPPKQAEKNQLVKEFTEDNVESASHLEDNWSNLEKEQAEYRQALAAALESAEKAKFTKQGLRSLSEWIAAKRAVFARRDFPPSLPELQGLALEFDNGYLSQELPPKADQKVQLCQALEEGSSFGDASSLTESWQDLESEQADYRQALDGAMHAIETQLAEMEDLQRWVDLKRQTFGQRDFPNDLQALESLRDQYDNDYLPVELPNKSSEVSQCLSACPQSPAAPDLRTSFAALQQEQVDYRRALEEAIRKKQGDEKRAKLMQWVEERTVAFQERDFAGFSKRDFEVAENAYADYKVDELPDKAAEKVIILQEVAVGGSPSGDNVLGTAWERLEREEALYREALDAAKKASVEPDSQVQVVSTQGQPQAGAQSAESNDTLPLLGDSKRPDCDCCCCRCRRSVWKCCCSKCCPQCHCKCCPCCAPPCCTIL